MKENLLPLFHSHNATTTKDGPVLCQDLGAFQWFLNLHCIYSLLQVKYLSSVNFKDVAFSIVSHKLFK